MHERNTVYRPSGRFSPSVFLRLPAIALPAAAILAVAYAYASLYIPLAGYITFVLTGGFGFLVGLFVILGLKSGKTRNPLLGGVLGLLVGGVALYLSWGVWMYAFARRGNVVDVQLFALLWDPGELWRLVSIVNAQGAWSLRNATPTGAILWAIWAVEAIIITGIPAFLGGVAAQEPFCERCSGWCEKTNGVFTGRDVPHDELKARLGAFDLACVASAGRAEPDADVWIRYDLSACGCGKTCTLDVFAIAKVKKNGEEKEESKLLIDGLLLPPEAVSALRALAAESPTA